MHIEANVLEGAIPKKTRVSKKMTCAQQFFGELCAKNISKASMDLASPFECRMTCFTDGMRVHIRMSNLVLTQWPGINDNECWSC